MENSVICHNSQNETAPVNASGALRRQPLTRALFMAARLDVRSCVFKLHGLLGFLSGGAEAWPVDRFGLARAELGIGKFLESGRVNPLNVLAFVPGTKKVSLALVSGAG